MDITAQFIQRDKAEEKDIKYWRSKSPEERLNTLQELREQYFTLYNKKEEYHEARKGLRRVYRIIKRTTG